MKRLVFPVTIFGLLAAVYAWTLAPGNFWIDSAAFSACNQVLGIPHAPGFPVYTILGRTFNIIFPADPIVASNIFSALTAAAAGTVCFLILSLMIKPVQVSPILRRLASATGALFSFFTMPVWQSAVRAEVYSLQILLSLLVIYLFLKSLHADEPKSYRMALAMVFFQGLCFANHSLLALITLPLIPALPILNRWFKPRAGIYKGVLSGIAVFALAVSFYLFLPIRSSQDPAINSGQPKTIGAAVKTITRTGEDYLPETAATQADYPKRAWKLAGFLFDQTGTVILLGLAAGLYFAIRQKKWPMLGLAALIPVGLGITVWAADFRKLNFDIVAYSALPLIILIILSFYGLTKLAAHTAERVKIGRAVSVVFILLVFFQFSGNLYACDLSGTSGPDRLARTILSEAPENAILLLNEDNTLLPLWYHCLAAGERPDLILVSTGALYRPSYRNQLTILYPQVAYPAEFDSYKIDDLPRAIESFCRINRESRPILVQYGTPGIGNHQLEPYGFLFRLKGSRSESSSASGPAPIEMLEYIAEGATDLLTRDFVARNAFNYGVYYDAAGNLEAAYKYFQYAIDTDSENPAYLLQLGAAFLKAGRQKEAVLLLQEATKTGEGCPEAEALLTRIAEREYGVK